MGSRMVQRDNTHPNPQTRLAITPTPQQPIQADQNDPK